MRKRNLSSYIKAICFNKNNPQLKIEVKFVL